MIGIDHTILKVEALLAQKSMWKRIVWSRENLCRYDLGSLFANSINGTKKYLK